ncbi:hypothetical protein HK100_012789 [Physocladia obscura]|uniref:Non-specific serine/threonine protein kinase n=1 Tax=Physocladia obscura TaxID=109957 RepID=A0AAD5T108_9FUNG|nr:hypothetical protein HK100_012789 [Physocladia obscura]
MKREIWISQKVSKQSKETAFKQGKGTFALIESANLARIAMATPKQTHVPMLGPYRLKHTIGEGEFGKVKLAVHSKTGSEVAVKLCKKSQVVATPNGYIKLMREISTLRMVKQHPYIISLIEVIETDVYIAIVMELAKGGELFEHILAKRCLDENESRKLFAEIICAVGYIHSIGIVHRDLKLENILLDANQSVLVTDFGFANKSYGSEELLHTSCGSPCYAAPELVTSEGYVGESADIWSCGVILYSMIAGYLPFDDDPENPDGENISLLYHYIMETKLEFPDHVPKDCRDLINRILVPDPQNRADINEIMEHRWMKPVKAIFEAEIERRKVNKHVFIEAGTLMNFQKMSHIAVAGPEFSKKSPVSTKQYNLPKYTSPVLSANLVQVDHMDVIDEIDPDPALIQRPSIVPSVFNQESTEEKPVPGIVSSTSRSTIGEVDGYVSACASLNDITAASQRDITLANEMHAKEPSYFAEETTAVNSSKTLSAELFSAVVKTRDQDVEMERAHSQIYEAYGIDRTKEIEIGCTEVGKLNIEADAPMTFDEIERSSAESLETGFGGNTDSVEFDVLASYMPAIDVAVPAVDMFNPLMSDGEKMVVDSQYSERVVFESNSKNTAGEEDNFATELPTIHVAEKVRAFNGSQDTLNNIIIPKRVDSALDDGFIYVNGELVHVDDSGLVSGNLSDKFPPVVILNSDDESHKIFFEGTTIEETSMNNAIITTAVSVQEGKSFFAEFMSTARFYEKEIASEPRGILRGSATASSELSRTPTMKRVMIREPSLVSMDDSNSNGHYENHVANVSTKLDKHRSWFSVIGQTRRNASPRNSLYERNSSPKPVGFMERRSDTMASMFRSRSRIDRIIPSPSNSMLAVPTLASSANGDEHSRNSFSDEAKISEPLALNQIAPKKWRSHALSGQLRGTPSLSSDGASNSESTSHTVDMARTGTVMSLSASEYHIHTGSSKSGSLFHWDEKKMRTHAGAVDYRAISHRNPEVLLADLRDMFLERGYEVASRNDTEVGNYRLKVIRPGYVVRRGVSNEEAQEAGIPLSLTDLSKFIAIPDGLLKGSAQPEVVPLAPHITRGISKNAKLKQSSKIGRMLSGLPHSLSKKVKYLKEYGINYNRGFSKKSTVNLAEKVLPQVPNSENIQFVDAIVFYVELQRVLNVPGVCVVDMNRIRGNIWAFKRLYEGLVAEMPLA